MSEAIAVVQRWLSALEAKDWETVFQLYDRDALVMAGPFIKPTSAFGPTEMAAILRAMEEFAGQARQFRFVWESGEVADDGPAPVVLARLRETMGEDRFVAGFRLSETGRISDIVVDPAAAATVAREAAADLMQVPAGYQAALGYLTALHHSYDRRRVGLTDEVRVLPDLHFTCQGRGDCCNAKRWNIGLTSVQAQSAQRLTTALGSGPLALVETPNHADVLLPETETWLNTLTVAAAPSGHCSQFDDAGRCAIHKEVGWQPIPACQMYPLQPVRTPDGIDVSLVFSCQSVCHNQGLPLSEQLPAIRQRLWPNQHSLYRIATGIPLVTESERSMGWPEYRAVEQTLLDTLSQLQVQGEDALQEGSAFLESQMQDQRPPGKSTGAALLHTMLADTDHRVYDAEAEWLRWVGTNLRWFEVETSSDMLPRYLRAVLFRKHGIRGGHGLGAAWGYAMLAYRLVMAKAAAEAHGQGRSVILDEDVLTAIVASETILAHRARTIKRAYGQTGHALEHPDTWAALIRP